MKTTYISATLSAIALLSTGEVAFAQGEVVTNLPDTYLKNLRNYEFRNTQGMKELAPNRHSWIPQDYEDKDEWELPDEEEIAKLKELGINFPDFSFITGTDTVDAGQKRQRTHTVEHILYALPGDALSLYPYYGLEETQFHLEQGTSIESTKGFLETFSHWYDYRSGGRVLHKSSNGKTYDLLDFPSYRGLMQITDNNGFYGGIYMSPGTNYAATRLVTTPQEYVDAVNAINNSGGSGEIHLGADLDFSGYAGVVPMLGEGDGSSFSGLLDGHGHAIRNLTISKSGGVKVGLISEADNGAIICNLIIDSTCVFEGKEEIGIVGRLLKGKLTVRNVVMNATVRGIDDGVVEQFASAILGRCDDGGSDNFLDFADIYIGGTVGSAGKGQRYDTVLCGWLNTEASRTNTILKNIVFNGTVHGPENLTEAKYLRRDLGSISARETDGSEGVRVERHHNFSIIYDNCYGNLDPDDKFWNQFTDLPQVSGWVSATDPGISEIQREEPNYGAQLLANSDHRPWRNEDQERRKAGTSAVFYFPSNEEVAGEFLNGRNEYVIAADFSQTFEPSTHIDVENMEVKEPLITIRHIFRIRDGREQAKALRENNREYVRRHQHKVTARIGANFQIRLDSPLPTGWGKDGGATNYYYKDASGEYHRVRRFGLRVLDGETRQHKYDLGDGKADDSGDRFELGCDIRMRRAQPSADGEYAEAITEDTWDHPVRMYNYHTMLIKPRVDDEAHFIVQVIAQDAEGNPIQSTEGDMVLMEYDITFLSEKGASLVTEKELYEDDTYLHARDEYMKEQYGEPVDKIDFDDYFAINNLKGNDSLKKKMISYSVVRHTDKEGLINDFPVWAYNSTYQGPGNSPGTTGMYHSFYKWPISWNRSGYSFGYNYRYDYNMYMLTTHSENVPYHAKADEWNDNIDSEIGLYDRLYYKTKRQSEAKAKELDEPVNYSNVKQGYYYYVNAASDPGVSARLNFKITCPGSRVVVSAWVAELSPAGQKQDEPANLSFNFVAVMNGTGERVTLHNFITGYLGEKDIYDGGLNKGGQLGKWLNVYYSFVPRLSEFFNDAVTFNDVDHFELELAHNGRSSSGSDYAIDDIRAYVVPPYADAGHTGYACDDNPIDVTLATSFETLLEKSGRTETFEGEAEDEIPLYYAFVDKEMIDEGADPDKAFMQAFAKGESTMNYGVVKFKSNYRSNHPYPDAKEVGTVENDVAYRFTTDEGDRLIRFRTTVKGESLFGGKEYYVVFHPALSDADVPAEDDAAAYFDICGECGYRCSLNVNHSFRIKLDGMIQKEGEEISVCENQSPVIQLNVWSLDETPVEVVKNAYFDWFDGSVNDFFNYRFKNYPESLEVAEDESDEKTDMTLSHALEVFRSYHSEAEGVAGILPENPEGDDGEELEQWMLDIIGVASAPDASGRTRLLLHQASYIMPPLDLEDGEEKSKVKVTAVPIIDLYPSGIWSVCSSPAEIGVKVANRTPVLLHGLSRIDYPEGLVDVPLRIGLSQLDAEGGTTFIKLKRKIEMPVRKVVSSDGSEKTFGPVKETKMVGDSKESRMGCLLLAQTNDPEYRHLGTLDDKGEETGYLLWAGEIEELRASSGVSGVPGENRFLVKFDEDFRFKEGYFYRFRFRFEEAQDAAQDPGEVPVCRGQEIFTLKIVPEYMQWTGAGNLSWDNDANWRRVSSSEILKEDADEESDRRFTDCADGNMQGYAPLGFTKVVVDAPEVNEEGVTSGENPWLYAPAESVEMEDEYSADVRHIWMKNPVCEDPSKDMDAVGDPTPMVQYDMTAYMTESADPHLLCRPWNGNSCAEIHFRPGSTLMNQQELNYTRAWVDVELDHSRWYILSTPLKDIYAGDFYLPTLGARQETELFREITYDKKLHNRFAPAVYQRGWDKGFANVYEFGKDDARNAAVKTFWSNVYNDVKEVYGGGTTFSIKTMVGKAKDPADKVLFRLPKADAEYLYYSADGKDEGHRTSIDRKHPYRLNDSNGTLTSVTANAGKYFLVGNPFMTHFDIRKFLAENSALLEQKYWIVTEKGMIAGSLADDESFVATGLEEADMPDDAAVIAPMQGFFVEAKVPALSVGLAYKEDMMRRYDSGENLLTGTTRSSGPSQALRITSVNGGNPSSGALLVAITGNEDSRVDAFDLRELGVPSTVFTSRDGRACSIDFCQDADGVEIGVIADEDTETTLRFEGVGSYAGLMLLDVEEDTLTPLEDVEEIRVKGAVSGRFYLTGGQMDLPVPESLIWSCEGSQLHVEDVAVTGYLRVQVCDTLGRVLADHSVGTSELTISLEPGISVVRMVNAKEERKIKINL